VDPAQNAVLCSVQHDIVLQPTNFALAFDSLELMYAQYLAAKINAREAGKRKVVTT
jgi:hypothetical protein